MDIDRKLQALADLEEAWSGCTACGLCAPVGRSRRKVVFGSGNPDAHLLIIGEAPGEDDERLGEPFRPTETQGELLDRFLASFEATRDDVYLAQVVGCWPTEADDPRKTRSPSKAEMAACRSRIEQIIEIVDPLVILLLGEVPMKALTHERSTLSHKAKDGDFPFVQVYTKGQCLTVERQAVVTFPLNILARKGLDMSVGSETYFVYKAFEKVFTAIATYNHLYFGTPMPERESR